MPCGSPRGLNGSRARCIAPLLVARRALANAGGLGARRRIGIRPAVLRRALANAVRLCACRRIGIEPTVPRRALAEVVFAHAGAVPVGPSESATAVARPAMRHG